ncbi:MAG: TRAP transporter TatT component family protein [Myxococcota bacterium]
MRALVLVALLAGCGKQIGSYEPPPAAPAAATTPADQQTALKAEADGLWNERGDKEKLKAALAKYEQLHAMDATNRDVAGKLVRGWYFLGDGHETEMDAKLSAWATSIEWGKKCLAINTEFMALMQKGDEDEASAARAFKVEDVPCLYWTSSALGKWAKASGLTTTLKHLPTVKAYMTRVGELDASFYYNGPDRYWGAYYAAIPSFAGQDLNKSKEYFEKAIAAHPTFLGHHVLYAGEWAVKSQNKAFFEEKLTWVLAQDPNAIPEVKAEAEAEQRKAKTLLDQKGEFFAD